MLVTIRENIQALSSMELEPPSEKDIETINDVAELEKMVSHINRKHEHKTGSGTEKASLLFQSFVSGLWFQNSRIGFKLDEPGHTGSEPEINQK